MPAGEEGKEQNIIVTRFNISRVILGER